jgi:hypothetical protein
MLLKGLGASSVLLVVGFATMGNPRHVDRLGSVVDFVDGPIIANSNPPFVGPALKFFAARRPGSLSQRFQRRHNASDQFCGQPMQIPFPRLKLAKRCNSPGEFAAFNQACLYLR